jgi:uncharacterized membrane protein
VPNGTTATFTLQVKIAKSTGTATLDGTVTRPELATVVTWNVSDSATMKKFGALPAGLILVGLILIPFGSGRRRQMTILACALIIAAVTAAGCDPCPSCAAMSSTQTLTAIHGTSGEGTLIKFRGLPASLGTISVSS